MSIFAATPAERAHLLSIATRWAGLGPVWIVGLRTDRGGARGPAYVSDRIGATSSGMGTLSNFSSSASYAWCIA